MAVPVEPAPADLEASANPAPPAAPVPAVVDPVLPAPPAPPAQPAGPLGGQEEQLNEVFYSFVRFSFFVLVFYLHRFCIVLLSIPGGSLRVMFAVCRP